jgi:hypothetical protein
VALWQSFAVGKQAEAERALMLAYREWYPDGCAETSPGSLKLNLDCPLVRAHVCSAYEGLVRVLGETGRSGEGEQYRQTAISDYACKAATFTSWR